jgi:hypothetical protein
MISNLYYRLPVIRQLRRLAEVTQELKRLADYEVRPRLNDLAALQSEQLRRDILRCDAYERRLNRFEHSVFSQNGEDGILAEIFSRIGTANRVFVEFGAGAGGENNTIFLLAQGWQGGWIEADPEHCGRMRSVYRSELQAGRLKLLCENVNRDNVNALVASFGVDAAPDLLSIDIDRNTWHVLERLTCIRPRVIAVEYNASFPPDVDWKVDYDAGRVWNGSNYMGASLRAYEQLLAPRGYALVACDLTGTNAFFVKQELAGGRFDPPFTAEHYYEPPRYALRPPRGHRGCYRDEGGA